MSEHERDEVLRLARDTTSRSGAEEGSRFVDLDSTSTYALFASAASPELDELLGEMPLALPLEPPSDVQYVVSGNQLRELWLWQEMAATALIRAREPLRFISAGQPITGPSPQPFVKGEATEETTGTPPHPQIPWTGHQLAWQLLRRGVLVAWMVVAGSVLIALGSWALMLAAMYLGVSVFCLADYAAYRLGGTQWFLPPRAALIGIYGFVGLSITMIVSTL